MVPQPLRARGRPPQRISRGRGRGLRAGHAVRALVREGCGVHLPNVPSARMAIWREPDFAGAIEGIDAIVFTLSSDGGGRPHPNGDYGGVRNAGGARGRRARGADDGHRRHQPDRRHNRATRPTTGSVAPRGWCVLVDCSTPSCARAGSASTARPASAGDVTDRRQAGTQRRLSRAAPDCRVLVRLTSNEARGKTRGLSGARSRRTSRTCSAFAIDVPVRWTPASTRTTCH
jgi:hypothetical protein